MTGTGTSSDPFLVATASDLCNVGNNLSTYYKQTADIDMAGVTFTPIGVSNTTAFTGTYDGDNHIISNLSISATTDYTGMFTYVNGGTLKNIKLYKETVNSTKGYMGGLAGKTVNSNITNCGISNITITGVDYVGGMIGSCASSVSKCFVVGLNLKGTSIMLGGFVGACNDNSTVTNNISQCFAEGTIDGTGQTFVGGFGGMISGNYLIENCFVQCNIKGNMYVGGFSGYTGGASYETYMHKCYTASPVTATSSDAGTFNGQMGSSTEILDCFWDNNISIVTVDKSTVSASNIGQPVGRTTAQMQTQSTFTDYDFTNIWAINSGEYPHLQYYQAINPNPTPPVTPTYKQNYHNLSSPLFGAFSPLF